MWIIKIAILAAGVTVTALTANPSNAGSASGAISLTAADLQSEPVSVEHAAKTPAQ